MTVNMQLNEVSEENKQYLADIIEEVLKQRIQGLKDRHGNWVAPAFPKLIYVLEEDNIYPNSKYYYLTVLCAKCNAGRMVPDYISDKIMKEIHGHTHPSMGKQRYSSCKTSLTSPEGVLINKYYDKKRIKKKKKIRRIA